MFFLYQLKKRKVDDLRSRKALISIFVNAVYLYDDKITLILNANGKPVTISEPLLDEIEAAGQSLKNVSASPFLRDFQSKIPHFLRKNAFFKILTFACPKFPPKSHSTLFDNFLREILPVACQCSSGSVRQT